MANTIGETISWGTLPIDDSRMDTVSKEYSELILKAEMLKSKYSRACIEVPILANKALMLFTESLLFYSKAKTDSEIDISKIDKVSILYTYLHNTYRNDFILAWGKTFETLIKNGKQSSDFVKKFYSLKLLDNQLLWLICNNKSDNNELRSFIGTIVSSYLDEPLDLELKAEFDKYVSVKLFKDYSLTSDGIYILPSRDIYLSDLLKDKNFTTRSGGGCTKLQANLVCSEITFNYNGLAVSLKTDDKIVCKGRSTTLRTPLLSIIDFVLRNSDIVLSDVLNDSSNITIYKGERNRVLAYDMSRGVNLSCSVIEQNVNGSIEFILPHPSLAKSSCELIFTLLSYINATEIMLHFTDSE